MRRMAHMRMFLAMSAWAVMVAAGAAQTAMPPTGATPFRDTSMLKPPAGAKVAIVEFEDLECPMCAAVSPVVWAAEQKYHVPRVHYDFIIPGHTWSRAAAVDARYLEDTVSPKVAEMFRRDVFAHQLQISSPEDLHRFATEWFKAHGVVMPFVMSDRCVQEVQVDCVLGARLGLRHTPTLVVVTDKGWIEVTDPRQLDAALDVAEAAVRTSGAGARHSRK